MNSSLAFLALLLLLHTVAAQTSCPPGTFIVRNRCSDCEPGTFQPLADQMSCEPCPDGTIAPSSRSTSCVTCPEFSTPNSRARRCLCDDGRAMDDGECKLCQPGTFFQRTFRTNIGRCLRCDPGLFQPDAGQSECLECPDGSSSGQGSAECISCAPKQFVSNDGRCASCPPGKFYNRFFNNCENCAANTFKAGRGLGPCIPCLTGEFAASGSASCIQCPEGTRLLSNGTCVDCPAGTHLRPVRSSTGFIYICERCRINTYMPFRNTEIAGCFKCTGPMFAFEGATECTRCPKNTVLLANGTCARCPEGSIYRPKFFRCQPCKFNEYARADRNACLGCPAGSFSRRGSSTCFPCPPGKVFIVRREKCGVCAPGREYNPSGAKCRPCDEGYYKPNRGNERCRFCDSNESNEQRTACVR